jgi:hypothetical protein
MERVIFIGPYDFKRQQWPDPMPALLHGMNLALWDFVYGDSQVLGARKHPPLVLTSRANTNTQER